ncbi:NAD(P)/FAD-dependent oxidoreductase [Frigidibacter oleivorans]|uniref:NAD(P)/FAD-dependent oxidoreductase n=1 Tax=Frigidibacter oleivorans TaxID=2487129 RepID=UPI000F8CDB92|nr:FAD-binding oxidoreductase [Frigidibacter oleivorans]
MIRFPIRADGPVAHPGPPPAACDVAVIGGGIIGVATALWLARAGVKVALLEKGRIAGEQSSRNWGWIRQQARDPAELPIMIEANRLWRDLAAEMPGLGFRQTGVMYLGKTQADSARYEGWLPHAQAHGLDTRILTKDQIAALLPHAEGWTTALWTASDARAEPWAAVPLLAKAAEAAGAIIVEECAVRALDLAAGRVGGVVTERGRIACDRVVVAGGAWSSLFLRAHGVAIPQLSVRSSVAVTEPLPEVFAGGAAGSGFAFRRREDGRYTLAPGSFHEFYIGPDAFRALRPFIPQIRADLSSTAFRPAAPKGWPDAWTTPRRWDADRPGPFEAMRVLEPAPNLRRLETVRAGFARAFPQLGEVKIATAWAGMIDTMPDIVPVVDAAPIPGLTIATGMCGHGFGIGPAFGRIVADLVRGRDPGHDLTRFRFSRFTDGSKIELGPWI